MLRSTAFFLSLALTAANMTTSRCSQVAAADDKPAGETVPMFNGKDLTGWVNVNCAPDTFSVKDGQIVTNGQPTGFLRTDRQYENFELEMDWMHKNAKEVGNSGLFVWGDPLPGVGTPYTRGIEVQVLVNLEYRDPKTNAITATSHGDLFSIHGARCVPDRPHPLGWERCLPSENRAHGGGEWNHYKVVANDGVIKLSVNGKEVSGVSMCNPRKGYLALESEGAECHFKNLTIKELPSTNPKPDEIAKVAEGHTSMFDGLTLKGWQTEGDSWKAEGGVLKAVGKSPLRSTDTYGEVELVFDWKLPEKSEEFFAGRAGSASFTFSPGHVLVGSGDSGQGGSIKTLKAGTWNRAIITHDGDVVRARINGEKIADGRVGKGASNAVEFQPAPGLELMNVFVRKLDTK